MKARVNAAVKASALTANDVARICSVDLKTIHNWAAKGKIPHARTSGGHLRFRRLDVVEFLRAYEYAVPSSLARERPPVCLVDGDTGLHASAKRALGRRFEITSVLDPIDALVTLAASDPEVLVFGDGDDLDALHWIERLSALPETRHIRLVVFASKSDRQAALLRAGARAFVPRGDFAALREALESMTSV